MTRILKAVMTLLLLAVGVGVGVGVSIAIHREDTSTFFAFVAKAANKAVRVLDDEAGTEGTSSDGVATEPDSATDSMDNDPERETDQVLLIDLGAPEIAHQIDDAAEAMDKALVQQIDDDLIAEPGSQTHHSDDADDAMETGSVQEANEILIVGPVTKDVANQVKTASDAVAHGLTQEANDSLTAEPRREVADRRIDPAEDGRGQTRSVWKREPRTRPTDVPDDVFRSIAARAHDRYPADDVAESNEINQQIEAHCELKAVQRPDDLSDQVLRDIVNRAIESSRRPDFAIRLYVVENEFAAYRELKSLQRPSDVPHDVFTRILEDAENRRSYASQLRFVEAQLDAYRPRQRPDESKATPKRRREPQH